MDVTFNTGNCILETIFVGTANQSREALSEAWMPRTRSVKKLIFQLQS
jgi:hypothetical protein